MERKARPPLNTSQKVIVALTLAVVFFARYLSLRKTWGVLEQSKTWDLLGRISVPPEPDSGTNISYLTLSAIRIAAIVIGMSLVWFFRTRKPAETGS